MKDKKIPSIKTSSRSSPIESSDSRVLESSFANGEHHITYPVYYEDTDAGGIVYYANYLKFAERARTEALRECGFSQTRLRDEFGIAFVVRRCEVDFLRPARLDDVITIHTRLTKLGRASFEMRQQLRCENMLLVSLDIRLACVGPNLRPMGLSEMLRDTLLATWPS